MKKYTTPTVDYTMIQMQDILTASNVKNGGDGGEDGVKKIGFGELVDL